MVKPKLVRILLMSLLFISLVSTMPGCSSGPPAVRDDPEVESNFRLWQEQKISNYDLTIRASRGGNIIYADPAIVRVRNSKAESIVSGEKDGRGMTTIFEEYETVEKIFEAIRIAKAKGARVKVSYNKKLGYPERVSLDFLKGADSWTTIEIKELKAVNPI